MGVLVHFSISTQKEFFVLSNLKVFVMLLSILSKESFISSNLEVFVMLLFLRLFTYFFLILFCNFQNLPGLCVQTLSMVVRSY